MSTTLEITFHCMNMFVEDEVEKRVHVLMPPTCACTHEPIGDHMVEGVDQHIVRVVFPRIGGRLNAARDAFVERPEDGKTDYVELEGWSLVLPGRGGEADLGDFPDEVADLTKVTGLRIGRALLGPNRNPRVAARVTLDGGRFLKQKGVATWKFDGREIELAQEVTWIVEGLPDGPFSWSRTRLKPAGERPTESDTERLPDLYPNAQGRIKILVFHGMERDFPKLQEREPHVTAQHFSAFYGIFENPPQRPIPSYLRKEVEGGIGCLNSRGLAALAS
jgi:hypothetical protein